jgi:hypothetical protein
MASQGPNDGTQVSSYGALGVYDWQDANDAISENDSYAYIQRNNVFQDVEVLLVENGVQLGDNRASFQDIYPPDPPEYWSYGGASDTWNATLTDTIVNSASFGVAIRWMEIIDSDLTDAIFIYNFGFSVPSGATIDGVIIEARIGPNSGGDFYPGVDNVRATVYYTAASSTNLCVFRQHYVNQGIQ